MKQICCILIVFLLSSSICYGESIFNPNAKRVNSIFSDPSPRASQIGDLITILINPKTSINTTNKYTVKKTSDAASSLIPLNLIGTPSFNPLALSGSNSSGSSEDGARTFDFTTTVSATIQEILPNGNFVILGQQQIMVGDKAQLMEFSGVVRPGDIKINNTIESTQIANVSLNIQGELGEIEQKRGIVNRILDWLF